jgi:hypothetical protein
MTLIKDARLVLRSNKFQQAYAPLALVLIRNTLKAFKNGVGEGWRKSLKPIL